MSCTLGFDQSYTNSGFCVFKDGAMVDYGTYKSTKAMDVFDRSVQVAQFVVDKVAEHNVEQINIEGLAFGIRGDATRDLAGLLFTIINAVRRQKPAVKIAIIPPTTLKKFATGTGKSDKAAMIDKLPPDVRAKFDEANLRKTTGLADVCDAYWLSTYK